MTTLRAAKKKDAGVGDDIESSILFKLTKEYEQVAKDEEFANDVTALFCGSKRSGKTSLIDRFINPTKDEKDQPKPTVALDYKYARYAAEGSSSKILAHIYDLGGDDNDELVSVPFSSTSAIGNIVVAIVLDLSEPWGVLPALEQWLHRLRQLALKSLEALSKESEAGAQRVEQIRLNRMAPYEGHPDGPSINLFPVPILIVGAKCDLFAEQHDSEKRKALCAALRYHAHLNGATLLFTALKDKVAMKSMRSLLQQTLFGVIPKGGLVEQTDVSKPICVPAGKDALPSIGAPHGAPASDQTWRDFVGNLFPDPNRSAKDTKKNEKDQLNEALSKYPETSVDDMVEQRVAELQQYRKQVERSQRLASEGITELRKD